jgi:aspartate/methionine/tyrosine aminotransferase
VISPVLKSLAAYPFTRLNDAIAAAEARGIEVIDFGMGDPREPTPEFVRRALVESVPVRSGYPLAQGLPEPTLSSGSRSRPPPRSSWPTGAT